MLVNLTDKERLTILFELHSALEVVNESIAAGEDTFIGEDETLMLLIAKLQDNENSISI